MSYEKKRELWEGNMILDTEKGLTGKHFSEVDKVVIIGRIDEELSEDKHKYKLPGNKFYRTKLVTERLSENVDFIPILVSDLLLEKSRELFSKGREVAVVGEFISCDRWGKDGKCHLDLFVAVKYACASNMFEYEDGRGKNLIYLDGHICKLPNYKETPLGRKITELCIAIDISSKYSVYIPCITWGYDALWASELYVGDRVKLYGRVQSRQHWKLGKVKEVYEVSVILIEKVE